MHGAARAKRQGAEAAHYVICWCLCVFRLRRRGAVSMFSRSWRAVKSRQESLRLLLPRVHNPVINGCCAVPTPMPAFHSPWTPTTTKTCMYSGPGDCPGSGEEAQVRYPQLPGHRRGWHQCGTQRRRHGLGWIAVDVGGEEKKTGCAKVAMVKWCLGS